MSARSSMSPIQMTQVSADTTFVSIGVQILKKKKEWEDGEKTQKLQMQLFYSQNVVIADQKLE